MGTEPCPFFWALSSGQSLKVLDYFQGLRTPHSGLLGAAGWQSPSYQAPSGSSQGQLLPAGTNGLLCNWGLSGSFLVGLMEGMFSVHRRHTTRVASPLYRIQAEEKTWFMNPPTSRIGLATSWAFWMRPQGLITKEIILHDLLVCIISLKCPGLFYFAPCFWKAG